MTDQDLLDAMVNQDADPVSVEPSFAGQICCISTHIPNRIMLLNCPGQLYNFLHSAVRNCYRLGVQKTEGQQLITLNGAPFLAPGPGEVLGPQIYCAIIQCMLNCGWEIVCGSSISLRIYEVHSIFFQKAKDSPVDGVVSVCALSFAESNTIRLIDAPVPLIELVKSTLDAHWKKGETNAVSISIQNGVPSIKLRGRVFDSYSSTELLAARMLLAQILSKITAAGYGILISCPTRITNAGMRPQELDTWIIRCPAISDSTHGGTDDMAADFHEKYMD